MRRMIFGMTSDLSVGFVAVVSHTSQHEQDQGKMVANPSGWLSTIFSILCVSTRDILILWDEFALEASSCLALVLTRSGCITRTCHLELDYIFHFAVQRSNSID